MSLFQRKPKPRPFIVTMLYTSKNTHLYDLYNLIYYPPISCEAMEEDGILTISNALYAKTNQIIHNAIYGLYQIPQVRTYFGKDFVHGLSSNYDPERKSIEFTNMDDTLEAERFVKELTVCVEKVLIDFLEKKDIYLFYQGDILTFVTQKEMPHGKNTRIDGHIVWND